jgi:hypothetical protein
VGELAGLFISSCCPRSVDFPSVVLCSRWCLVVVILWALVRYSFVSAGLSKFSALFVEYLKWPAALGSALYLFFGDHRYGVGLLALLWPFMAWFIPLPGQVGRIEMMLAKNIAMWKKTRVSISNAKD